jgi:hypothetical protein
MGHDIYLDADNYDEKNGLKHPGNASLHHSKRSSQGEHDGRSEEVRTRRMYLHGGGRFQVLLDVLRRQQRLPDTLLRLQASWMRRRSPLRCRAVTDEAGHPVLHQRWCIPGAQFV